MTAASVSRLDGLASEHRAPSGNFPYGIGRISVVGCCTPHRRALDDGEFSAAVAAVTSAFGDPTRRDIYLFARESDDGVTAAEVAERFDTAPQRGPPPPRQAGRRRVPRGPRRAGAAGGGAGRPSKHYRVADKALDRLEFPARHDDLLVTLLGRALALLPPEQAEAMAEEVGEEYGRSLAA